jgi:hypothetical protein
VTSVWRSSDRADIRLPCVSCVPRGSRTAVRLPRADAWLAGPY